MMLVFGVIILFLFCLFIYLFVRELGKYDSTPVEKEIAIVFSELAERVDIKTKTWGLIGGNHQKIIVSIVGIGDQKEVVATQNITFDVAEMYYKKEGLDTLRIYVAASSIPAIQCITNTSVKLVITELKNYDEIMEYDQHYTEYGLEKIDVY